MPQAPKKKKKKIKVIDAYLKELNNEDGNSEFQIDESMENIAQILRRKEFVLKPTDSHPPSDHYTDVNDKIKKQELLQLNDC